MHIPPVFAARVPLLGLGFGGDWKRTKMDPLHYTNTAIGP